MRVVFLGNHTVGVRVLEVLRAECELVAAVAHPWVPDEGSTYESIFDTCRSWGIQVARGAPRDEAIGSLLNAARPDLLWVTDYKFLLPEDVLSLAPLGAVNLHPSLLPRYRGRASINWAILHGESTLGLTAHFIDKGMDTGDIICQRSYELSEDEDVGDALRKLYPMYQDMTREVIRLFRSGTVPRIPQNHGDASAFGARKPEDGLIDWSDRAVQVHNLVRAVARPYPGAFTSVRGVRVNIWRCSVWTGARDPDAPPGTIVDFADGMPVVACGSGTLRLDSFETSAGPLRRGMTLGS